MHAQLRPFKADSRLYTVDQKGRIFNQRNYCPSFINTDTEGIVQAHALFLFSLYLK